MYIHFNRTRRRQKVKAISFHLKSDVGSTEKDKGINNTKLPSLGFHFLLSSDNSVTG
jgi:hypothetical protein